MTTLKLSDYKSQRFKHDPFPTYARLREEAPVHSLGTYGTQSFWLVSRHDDVLQVLKHPSLSKDVMSTLNAEESTRLPWFTRFFAPLTQMMLSRDPPDHTRLRSLVHKVFTPRLIEQLRSRVQSLSDELLDAGARKGSMDLVEDFAFQVPVTIIAEMLGVPARDHKKFQRWSNRLTSTTSPRDALVSLPSIVMFARYLRQLIEVRRAAPGQDLLSALIQAEEAGDRLNREELISMVFLLLVAGHETTVNLISGGTLALLQNPEQLERLRRNPDLIGPAVEELLRYVSPVEVATDRIAREDFEVRGVHIRKGDMVYAGLAAANRDPLQFKAPDVLDLGRDPNRHVAFGMGIHYCLGAPLARLEGQIALRALVDRFPRLRLARPDKALQWRTGLIIRGPRRLPVALS